MLLIFQTQLKRMGLDNSIGIDNHFIQQAKNVRKPIQELETAEFQMKLLSSLPEKLQDELPLATLLQVEQGSELMDRTFAAWRAGDANAMEEVVAYQVRDYPFLRPVMDKLLDERNDEMSKKIDRMLQNGKTYFVAVGAGHLVGQRGIVEQLKARNYRVDQM